MIKSSPSGQGRGFIGFGLGFLSLAPVLGLSALAAVFIYFQGPAHGDEAKPPGAVMVARVVRVADGDTIVVEAEDGQEHRIRLYGLDAPEKSQAYGTEATQYLASHLEEGQTILLKTIDHDRYGRLVSLIHLIEKEPLNRKIISSGLAWRYNEYCRIPECEQWAEDEAQARQNGLGLWHDHEPMPPWEYRHR